MRSKTVLFQTNVNFKNNSNAVKPLQTHVKIIVSQANVVRICVKLNDFKINEDI